MWSLLYRALLSPIAMIVSRAGAPFSTKIRRGLAGRRAQNAMIATASRKAISASRDNAFAIHFHAASVGEFEQAKPLIEALRNEQQAYRITSSFFSPSGIEQQGAYDQVDAAWYLPEDRASHARRFLDHVAPNLIVIMRYDLWPGLLAAASDRGIPCVLVCGTMRADSARLWPIARGFFGWLYGRLQLIACVGDGDVDVFRKLAPDVPVEICGDTRYDRVIERASSNIRSSLPIVREQLGAGPILVAGSTWEPDEELLAGVALGESLRLIIVPHEPTPSHIASLRGRFDRSILLSEIEAGAELQPGMTLIVDRTGLLLGLYSLADIAYVGGGFGAGVHSVLEPAAYGIPVVCGPAIECSPDALALWERNFLNQVDDAADLDERIKLLVRIYVDRVDNYHPDLDLAAQAAAFVRERAGATNRILSSLRRHKLLPNASTEQRSDQLTDYTAR